MKNTFFTLLEHICSDNMAISNTRCQKKWKIRVFVYYINKSASLIDPLKRKRNA